MKKGLNLLLKYSHSGIDRIPTIMGENKILSLIKQVKQETYKKILEHPEKLCCVYVGGDDSYQCHHAVKYIKKLMKEDLK